MDRPLKGANCPSPAARGEVAVGVRARSTGQQSARFYDVNTASSFL